ncbi:hypothetical protein ACGFI9_20820 [Micromonospora sp. NPDC048930]|uniref:hypothetical protein n=1 Tax=Micromonospora sp. NPDC048930 TaxID=3364261 RepID=UPI00371A764F
MTNPKMRRRAPRPSNVYAVPVSLAGVPLPEFTPSEHVNRPAEGWTVETVWLAAVRYARAHELRRGGARVAWLAFSSAYDAATGAKLRREEIRMRLTGHDPEPAAWAVDE